MGKFARVSLGEEGKSHYLCAPKKEESRMCSLYGYVSIR